MKPQNVILVAAAAAVASARVADLENPNTNEVVDVASNVKANPEVVTDKGSINNNHQRINPPFNHYVLSKSCNIL